MRVGLQIPSFTLPGGPPALGKHLVEIAQAAEEAGFSSIWVMDHFFQLPMIGEASLEMLESYSTLAYLAGVTRRVRLGTMVTGVTYRNPGVLVKAVTTLDVLSSGRANLGIGAAWYEREHEGLGVPFPPVSQRFEMLEETLQIALQMWSGEVKPFNGKHFQLAEPLCSPGPLSRPHPPILIGGSGEKKTLRLVAQYGNACNLFWNPRETPHKLEVLREHCRQVGRDYDQIEKTTLGTFSFSGEGRVTPDGMAEMLSAQARGGIQQAIFSLRDVSNLAEIELIGKEVLPRIASL